MSFSRPISLRQGVLLHEVFFEPMEQLSQIMRCCFLKDFEKIWYDTTLIDIRCFWTEEDGSIEQLLRYFHKHWRIENGLVYGVWWEFNSLVNVGKIHFDAHLTLGSETIASSLVQRFWDPLIQEMFFGYSLEREELDVGFAVGVQNEKNIFQYSGIYNTLSLGVNRIKTILNNSLRRFASPAELVFVSIDTIDVFGIIKFTGEGSFEHHVIEKYKFYKQDIYQEHYNFYVDKYYAALGHRYGFLGQDILTMIINFAYNSKDVWGILSKRRQRDFLKLYFMNKNVPPVIFEHLKLIVYALRAEEKYRR